MRQNQHYQSPDPQYAFDFCDRDISFGCGYLIAAAPEQVVHSHKLLTPFDNVFNLTDTEVCATK